MSLPDDIVTRLGLSAERVRKVAGGASGGSYTALMAQAELYGSAAREITSLRSELARKEEALRECEEFFDERADADQPAGCDSPIPNDEMTMLVKVRAALGDQS